MIENIIYGSVIALETILFTIIVIYITKSKNRLYNDLLAKYEKLEKAYKLELQKRLKENGNIKTKSCNENKK